MGVIAARIVRSSRANSHAHYGRSFVDPQVVVEHELEHLTLARGQVSERVAQSCGGGSRARAPRPGGAGASGLRLPASRSVPALQRI